MIDETVIPYRPGDMTIEGYSKFYTGPKYVFQFPVTCDIATEVMFFSGLGYDARRVETVGKSCDVTVLGRVPDWMLDRLNNVGIKHEVQEVKNIRLNL